MPCYHLVRHFLPALLFCLPNSILSIITMLFDEIYNFVNTSLFMGAAILEKNDYAITLEDSQIVGNRYLHSIFKTIYCISWIKFILCCCLQRLSRIHAVMWDHTCTVIDIKHIPFYQRMNCKTSICDHSPLLLKNVDHCTTSNV